MTDPGRPDEGLGAFEAGDGAAQLALEREQARREELERELAALRRSEAFRVGHALVMALRALRPLRRRTGGLAGKSKQLAPPDAKAARSSGRRRTGSVLLISLDGDLDGLAAELDSLRGMLVSFEPVLMADAAALRDYDGSPLTVEHLVPLRTWQLHRPAIEWGPYVAGRIARTVAEYDPDAIVVLSSSPTGRAADLSAILAPIVLPGMARSEANLI